MEDLDGQSLPSVWITYTDEERLAAAQEVVGFIVGISEFTFDRIGGLTLAQEIGPTVEGTKLFQARAHHLKVALTRLCAD